MTLSVPIKVDKSAFFDFIRKQAEGRFEYERGRIVQQMTGGTFNHSLIVHRFILALSRQLDPLTWAVTGQSRGVETAETVRYPDVVVERMGAEGEGLATNAPTLIVEVLSPTTTTLDLNVKPAEYMSLLSLVAYIVASPSKPECVMWRRTTDGFFPGQPLGVEGRDAVIGVDSAALSVRLPLAEIYRGIGAGG